MPDVISKKFFASFFQKGSASFRSSPAGQNHPTVTRMPRTQGRPPITSGFWVVRVICSITFSTPLFAR
jgi:hypothetical protein